MASSKILSQTLYSITSIKLDQLSKQKSTYETAKNALLQAVSRESNPERTKVLLEGALKLPTMTPLASSTALSTSNIRRFLEQAEFDPSVSASSIEDSERALRNELDVHSEKYRFAELYGKLVNEWIASGKSEATPDDASDSFIPLGRAEAHAQRATWEEYVFDPKQVDAAAIKSYLGELFQEGPKEVQEAFKRIPTALEEFQSAWDSKTHFDEESLDTCIRGLLRSDLLNDQKRTTLNDFLGNKAVLREIADVLNMRMQTRASWAWEGPCTIEQRRSLNGRYRFYPDEDLLQSIFLYYIGRSWAVELRARCDGFMRASRVLRPSSKPLTREERRRRRYFLGRSENKSERGSVQDEVYRHFMDEILLDQLPKAMGERRGGYNDDSVEEEDTRKSPVEVVQKLLQILQSTIIMQRGLGRETAVVRSDFKWFGPSVSHAAIFAVLEFLGVEEGWIDFFRRALECPLQFEDDPADTPARVRRRGLALSTPMADFFAESMLFCLDFAVNQKADGASLYRLHDDMWLFDSTKRAGQAWGVITEFTTLFGLDINEEKTGSAIVRPAGVRGASAQAAGLPEGDVTWGFLKLDASSGRFQLDQSKVDTHIDELRLQLAACKSVFDWIRAWNTYGARFFSTNFGSFCNCYSQSHLDSVLQTYRRIQDALFPGVAGGVGGRLKAMLAERFGVDDVPDGYLYYPVDLGGLGLRNPFVMPYISRTFITTDADTIMEEYHEKTRATYEQEKAAFEEPSERTADDVDSRRKAPEFTDLRDEPFMSLEEYSRHPERKSEALSDAFRELLTTPMEAGVRKPENVIGLEAALKKMKQPGADDRANAGWGGSGSWENVSAYDRWVCVQHAPDMVSRFGGVTIVEKGLLPMGLMDMLRQSRFKWQT